MADQLRLENEPNGKKVFQPRYVVCKTYGVRKAELVKSKGATFNAPRGGAIYLARAIKSEDLMNISRDPKPWKKTYGS